MASFIALNLSLISSFDGGVTAFGISDYGCSNKINDNLLSLLSHSRRESLSFSNRSLLVLQAAASATSSSGSSSHNNNNNNNSGPSSRSSHAQPTTSFTARESAVLVDWEPVSELDRRIDDGMLFEHDKTTTSSSKSHQRSHRDRNNHQHSSSNHQDSAATPTFRGIFCGYRMTSYEYQRLKSAHPANDHDVPLNELN